MWPVMMGKRHVVILWAANALFLFMMLTASVLCDANGRLPGLDETSSLVIVSGVMLVGLVIDALVGCLDRKRRLIAVAVGLVYALMLLPALV